jgi:hypothetical protein
MRVLLTAASAALAVTLGLVLAYGRWMRPTPDPLLNLLGQLPPEATSVFYLDLQPLRQSPFLAALYRWAPAASQIDADYTQFIQSTGFNYERDLNRVGLGLYKDGPNTTLFAVAEGHFDQKKIAAYALKTGTRTTRNGRDIFTIPESRGTRPILFTFLKEDRIAITNGNGLAGSSSSPPSPSSESQAWRERFSRLAGSPFFAVIRQVPGASPFSAPAAAGFQSPDLSRLIAQLQWVTVAAKPDADQLRIILEGEGSPQLNTLQMSDLINGMLVFAEAGLNDPKLRAQLQPQVREAYLQLFKSVDVSRLDRGDTKSVRILLEISPSFLEAIRPPAAGESAPLLPKIYRDRGGVRN